MTVADLLKQLDKLPSEADVYIADNNLTGWPVQIPIDKIIFDKKTKDIFLLSADVQSLPPDDIIEEITFRTR